MHAAIATDSNIRGHRSPRPEVTGPGAEAGGRGRGGDGAGTNPWFTGKPASLYRFAGSALARSTCGQK